MDRPRHARKVLGDVVVARRRGHKSVRGPRPEDLKCSGPPCTLRGRSAREQLAKLAQA